MYSRNSSFETSTPVSAFRGDPLPRREAVERHVRVHADPRDDPERIAAVHALAEDAPELPLPEDDVVRPLQGREDGPVAERLHDGHPAHEAEEADVRLGRLQDDRAVQAAGRREPRAAVAAAARDLAARDDDRALVRIRLEELLGGVVRGLDRVEANDPAAYERVHAAVESGGRIRTFTSPRSSPRSRPARTPLPLSRCSPPGGVPSPTRWPARSRRTSGRSRRTPRHR